MSISWACSADSGSSPRSTCIAPDIEASGLRISWAIPAAISPTAARRWRICAVRSSPLMSVTSWKVKMTPRSPAASGSGAALTPSSMVRPSGRA